MSVIKKVWITEHDANLVALTIESTHVVEKHLRVKAYSMEFPEVPTERNPLRHTVNISLLGKEDLEKILVAICNHLGYDLQV
jgi:hypothetical protein